MILSPLQRLGRLQAANPALGTRVRVCWELEQCTSPMRCLYSAETTPEQLLPCEQEDEECKTSSLDSAVAAASYSEAACSHGTQPEVATPISAVTASSGSDSSEQQCEVVWSNLKQATVRTRDRNAAFVLMNQPELSGAPGQGTLSRLAGRLKSAWTRIDAWCIKYLTANKENQ